MDVLTDVLTAAQIGRPVSARTVGRAPWAVRMELATGAQFHVVAQGDVWLSRAGAEPLRLGPGDVVLLPHGTTHVLGDDPATPPVALSEVAGSSLGGPATDVSLGGTGAMTTMLCGAYALDHEMPPHPLLRALPDVVHLPASRGTSPELRAAVDLLSAEIEQSRPGSTAIVAALVDALFAYVLRSWCEQRRDQCPAWWAALSDPVVGRALSAVHGDPGQPWSVAGLASVAGLSRAAFARRFAALVGEPPLAYLTRWRMVRAQMLLRTGSAPLDTIARAVGYESSFAFGKAFKRFAGVSPGRYREHARSI